MTRLALALLAPLAAGALLASASADAVPSFARQTGLECNECHFSWPELTAAGRRFKLGGYVLNSALPDAARPLVSFAFDGEAPVVPVSVQALLSDTNLRTSIPATVANAYPHLGEPYVQEASIFLNGQLAGPVGCFCQWTYDGVLGRVTSDNTDLRVAHEVEWGRFSGIVGLSLNNNPTVTDVYNTTPAWGWPYATSAIAPLPVAAPLITGALQGSVAGLTAYGLLDKTLYVEAGAYRRADRGLRMLALGVPLADQMVLDGAAPYYRLALQREWLRARHSAEVGVFGLSAYLYPNPLETTGASDHDRDAGFDAQYQYVTDAHRFSGQAALIRESRTLYGSYGEGAASHLEDHLNQLNAKASYYYLRRYGISLGYERVTGSADAGLYGGATPVGSGIAGAPGTEAWIAELDYVFSLTGRSDYRSFRLVAQYTAYRKFDGAASNYDGFGRSASANDTLYLLLRAVY
jgi:hypothetical protein